MNIVYVIGKGSKWHNNELRYSLRSIDQYAINLNKVFIVGILPDFIDPSTVIHIPMADQYDAPHKNVYAKVKAAMDDPRTGDAFLLSSDDHFLAQPTNLATTPIYYKGNSMPTAKSLGKGTVGSDSYVHTLMHTAEVMQWYGLPNKFFEGHTNKLMLKSTWRFLTSIGLWEQMWTTEEGMTIGAPMAAATLFLHPTWKPVYRPDIKIRNFDNTDKTILSTCQSFSIGDSAIRNGMADYFAEKYPHPSRFEKKVHFST